MLLRVSTKMNLVLVLGGLLLVTTVVLCAEDYRVGPGDVIEISVWRRAELSNTTDVSTEGTIRMPVVGKLSVQGLTVKQIRELITEGLAKEYMKDPQVVVDLRQYRSRKAYVLGSVKLPNAYILKEDSDILDMIARAGGTSPSANRNGIMVIRPGEGAIRINYLDLLNKADLSQNLTILPGDTIVVPDVEEYGVLVLGEVESPGWFSMHTRLTVLDAIALAGSVNSRGVLRKTRVVRSQGEGKGFQIIEVNIQNLLKGKGNPDNIVLEQGDVVYVPAGFLAGVDDFFAHLAPALQTILAGEQIILGPKQWRFYKALADNPDFGVSD